MQITSALDRLNEARRNLASMVQPNLEVRVFIEKALALLESEAGRQDLLSGLIREKTTSLRHHFGIVLGVKQADGHSREQHLLWIVSDLQALWSDHYFGKALEAEAKASGTPDTTH